MSSGERGFPTVQISAGEEVKIRRKRLRREGGRGGGEKRSWGRQEKEN